ncbi:hypothetical protein E2C01_085065 [Portunus trituberculatus]|uniref:Uncharacterized protein n=1 Tax=Portunus trituberculatus TaxID=210409 RepID=A0A5B7JAZ0_PORTR|nr:hypothetical protein [Portunus trituberculatus]
MMWHCSPPTLPHPDIAERSGDEHISWEEVLRRDGANRREREEMGQFTNGGEKR